VAPNLPAYLSIETAADGHGTAIATESVAAGTGTSFAAYAITRNSQGDFVANVAATWSLNPVSGGVVGTDFVAAGDGKSATFTGHLVGSGTLHAVAGAFSDDTGLVTVTAGFADHLVVENAATSNGAPIGPTTLEASESIVVYSNSHDQYGNFVANVNADWSVVAGTPATGGLATSDLSVTSGASTTFTGHLVGTGTINAAAAGLTGMTGTVTVLEDTDDLITAFSFQGLTPAVIGTINEGTHTVALTVPYGTDRTALVPTIAISIDASVSPLSGVAQDFTNPVTYTVTAKDSGTESYTVTVVVAPNPAKAITAFSFASPAVTGVITESAHTIALTVPYGTDVTGLVATFTTTGASVKIGSTTQVSGTTPNNFTSPVTYVVTAADGYTQAYTVTVAVATATKAITAFSFAGLSPAVIGTINEGAHAISLTVSYGTGRTALVATFTTNGTSVKVGGTTQVSGTTPNNFTNSVTYTVTAADGSTQAYAVTVTVAPAPKALTAFSFQALTPAVIGTINEGAHTVALTVPYATNVSALVATFTTTGTSVKVSGTTQVSGTTPHNFTNSVAYTVTAADATTQIYTVTVTVAPNPAKAITAFSFQGLTSRVTGVITESAHTIALTVPYGTSVSALVATFSTAGASVKVGGTIQVSGTTPNNFTNPVVYTVTASDGSTQVYTVTVAVAGYTDKAITAFSFLSPAVTGVITESAHTITLTVPSGTNVTNLVATFATSGVSVKVGTVLQQSGSTGHNFTSPVTYVVTAADGYTQAYTVTVIVAGSTAKAITAFSFAGLSPVVAGIITESTHTIALTVPYGTDVTALAATFSITGVSVKVGGTTQVSGTTPHNFTSPVTYTVTAADASTQAYAVTVTVALNPAKAITAFSFQVQTGLNPAVIGVLNQTDHTIAMVVPGGTDVTALVATFTTTGASVKIGSTIQVSGTTPNNFTNPIAFVYTVTAADGSTQDYLITVEFSG
jgi:hypothetical protein